MLQGQYGFGQAHELEEALSHKAEAHNLFPMRQLVLTISTLILADRYLHLFDSLTLINPGPFPVRRPNADPSGSSGNRIANQAQNNTPTAARQCACNRRPRCGNVFFDLPPENLFLILFFCMLCLILIKVSFLMVFFFI